MVEIILSALELEFPTGRNKLDVSAQVCSRLTQDDLDRLSEVEIEGLTKETYEDSGTTVVSFAEPPEHFSKKELRILISLSGATRCQAFLFRHTL